MTSACGSHLAPTGATPLPRRCTRPARDARPGNHRTTTAEAAEGRGSDRGRAGAGTRTRNLLFTRQPQTVPGVLAHAVLAPMRSGLVKGVRDLPFLEAVVWLASRVGGGCRAAARGQGGAPRWTNDLAAGEDRRRIMGREGPDSVSELARMHPFGPRRAGGPHDGESGPGLLSQAGRPCCRLMRERERARYWPSPVGSAWPQAGSGDGSSGPAADGRSPRW